MANQLIEVEEQTVELEQVEHDPVFNKRARRAFKEGYKDGFSGLYSPLNCIPAKFKQHYNAGYALGVHDYGQQDAEPVDNWVEVA